MSVHAYTEDQLVVETPIPSDGWHRWPAVIWREPISSSSNRHHPFRHQLQFQFFACKHLAVDRNTITLPFIDENPTG